MTFPNLVIGGAPKCGTTALFDYLAMHPDICPASVKETYFLMDEGYPLYREHGNVNTLGLAGYHKFFLACEGFHVRYWIEATPDYLYQRTALRVLADLPTRPLVVFVLRKPSERVYSLYRFAQNNIGSLSKRVSLAQFIIDVRRGQGSVRGQLILEQAVEHSKYVQYLERWYERLGGNRIHVFLFEEMVEDPRAFMTRMMDLLDLDDGAYHAADLAPRNETVQIRIPALQKWRRRLRSGILSASARRWLGAVYTYLNVAGTRKERTADEVQVLAELDAEFDIWNRRLRDLANVDLSRWRADTGRAPPPIDGPLFVRR